MGIGRMCGGGAGQHIYDCVGWWVVKDLGRTASGWWIGGRVGMVVVDGGWWIELNGVEVKGC